MIHGAELSFDGDEFFLAKIRFRDAEMSEFDFYYSISIGYGPHVVGRYDSRGEKLASLSPKERRGKGGSMEAGENQEQVFSGSHTPLEISHNPRDSHFPTAPATTAVVSPEKAKAKAKAKPKTKARAA
jgi:hypothetical protein